MPDRASERETVGVRTWRHSQAWYHVNWSTSVVSLRFASRNSGTHRPVTVMCHDGYSSHDDVSQDSSYHCVYSCKHELHDNL
jgi:hypothetical protein